MIYSKQGASTAWEAGRFVEIGYAHPLSGPRLSRHHELTPDESMRPIRLLSSVTSGCQVLKTRDIFCGLWRVCEEEGTGRAMFFEGTRLSTHFACLGCLSLSPFGAESWRSESLA